jgi:hypothetical protein
VAVELIASLIRSLPEYRDPTGHFPLVSWDSFVNSVNAYKASQRELDIWVGENHYTPQGNYLAIKFKTSELPLKLPAFSILLYSPVSLQLYLPI